ISKCFLLRVDKKGTYWLANDLHAGACGRHPAPQVIVHTVVKRLVETGASSLPNVTREDNFRLEEKFPAIPCTRDVKQLGQWENGFFSGSHEVACRSAFSQYLDQPNNHVRGAFVISQCHAKQRICLKDVVIVDPCQQFASRTGKALVERVRL